MKNDIKKPVFTGQCLSDRWLENNYNSIITSIREKKYLIFDFTTLEWAELSTLISLCGIILREREQVKIVDFLFDIDDNSPRTKKDVFSFLIESNFFITVRNILSDFGKACRIWFLIKSKESIHYSRKKARFIKYIKNKYNNVNEHELVRYAENNDGLPLLGVNLICLPKDIHLDRSFFHTFGIKSGFHKDQFIFQITYKKTKELKEFLDAARPVYSSNNLKSLIELAKLSFTKQRYLHRILDDIGQIWIYELLSNAVQHGGDCVVYAVRKGDGSIRNRIIDNEQIYYHGYAYRYKLIEENYTDTETQFIDMYILDNGDGFISLLDSLNRDKNISKLISSDKSQLQRLHRFSLWPNSTSKANDEIVENKFPVTGLGIIAEKVIEYKGNISIKDKNQLTYFNERSLNSLTNVGNIDYVSKEDMNFTMVSSIVPISSDIWAIEQGLFNLDITEKVEFEYVNLLSLNSDGNIVRCFKCFQEKEGEHYHFQEYTMDRLHKDRSRELTILDITNCTKYTTKPKVLKIVNLILYFRKKSIPIVIYGADTSIMRIFQNIFESVEKLRKYGGSTLKEKDYLICPMISTSFKMFLCGSLVKSYKEKILDRLNHGKVDELTELLIEQWGYINSEPIPLRDIERIFNKYNGQKFLNDISDYITYDYVEDIHGNTLDRFYEVKSYLSNIANREKWYNDIVRYIGTNRTDVVITDSSEVKALVNESIKDTELKDVIVGRIHQNEIELSEDIKSIKKKKILLLIACQYEGSTIEKVSHYRNDQDLDIVCVITLLDLTGNSRVENEKLVRCKFDRLAKTEPPIKLLGKNYQPKYMVNSQARLIPKKAFKKEGTSLFKAHIPKNALFPLLLQSENIRIGHTTEYEHHYDVFIDVRNIIASNEVPNIYFRALIQNKIADGSRYIIYPEDSELWSVLATLRYLKVGNNVVCTIPTRRVLDDIYICSEPNPNLSLKNESLILLDEGAYTCFSILGILKFLLKLEPKQIDVIVLEKRIARENYLYELIRLKEIYLNKINIEFHCILDIDSPCWGDSDCPYCKTKTPYKKNKLERFLEELNVDDYFINTDADFYLWFVGEIYKDRNSSKEALIKVSELRSNYQRVMRLAVELILIHSEVIYEFNLIPNAIDVIKAALPYAKKDTEILTFLEKSANSYNKSKLNYFSLILPKVLRHIHKQNVYIKLFEILHNNKSLIHEAAIIVKKCNITHEQLMLWNNLLQSTKHGIFPKIVEFFFSLTKIHKLKPHHTLGSEIKKYGLDDQRIQVKVQNLKIILSYMEDITKIQNLKDNIDNQDGLIAILNDQSFKENITKQICIRADHLIKAIAIAARFKFFKKLKDTITRKRTDGRSEIPLICMQNLAFDFLIDYLEENSHHGKVDYDAKLDESGLIVFLKFRKVLTVQSIDRIKKSSSRRQAKNILQTVGCRLDYDFDQNRLKLHFKVVEHEKI